jgi:hypothetical protein
MFIPLAAAIDPESEVFPTPGTPPISIIFDLLGNLSPLL